MGAIGSPASSGGGIPGEDLFWLCQRWAEAKYRATSGQGKRPSGARIYYVVRQVMLRKHPGAVIKPDSTPIAQALADEFQALMPEIAKHLAQEWKYALRLVDSAQVDHELERVMRGFARATLPQIEWATEHHVGIYEAMRQRLQRLWETFWEQADIERYRLRRRSRLVLVRPIALPGMPGKAALKRLRQALEEDRANPAGAVLPPDAYLYEEPLSDWLLRPLLTGGLFIDLCNVLADLTLAVPDLVRKRRADLGVSGDDVDASSTSALKQELLRRLPLLPQGTARGAAIAFYAIAAWRVARQTGQAALAAPAAGSHLLPPDLGLLPFAEFQRLLAQAMQTTEHLLWDETLAIRALPASSPEQRRVLWQALLSARMRRQFDRLAQMERHRAAQGSATLPRWAAWETPRDATCDEVALRLANSIAPDAITRETLPDLLRLPTAALVNHYVYHMTVGAWLRDALHAALLDGNALLAWCQALAEALAQEQGGWLPETPGAPATPEQAARAIFWYTKLALEARVGPVPGFSAPAGRPKRADDGLVVWLESTLPAEALELAVILAPLVARMLHFSASGAAQRGEALFVARIKKRDERAFEQLTQDLRLRAKDLNLSEEDAEAAVQQALNDLDEILERLLLPDEIGLEHLRGEKSALLGLDISITDSYTIFQGNYQFIGDFRSFTKGFIRPPDPPAEAPVEPISTLALDPMVENQAALGILELLLTNAQSPEKHLAGDARRLIEWVFTTNTGRQMIEQFARQGKVAASALSAFWQRNIVPAADAAPAISPTRDKTRMLRQGALARFLMLGPVQQSAALRRAVGDLFEIPLGLETPRRVGLRLGDVEHLAPWASRKALREVALRILAALEAVPATQRGAICARLLAQEQMALTLHLLQPWGWARPDWFRMPEDARPSPQIFQYARASWQRQLAEANANWRARAMMVEWLRAQFWGHSWSALLMTPHGSCLYRTLTDALYPRLRAVLPAIWRVATQERLASFSEVIGITGSLPPQLPAQLDDPVYFEAVWKHLSPQERQRYALAEDEAPDEPPVAWLRQDWQFIRVRAHLWFLTLAGLADENEQRVVLAAMSLANGDARLMDRWLDGEQPTEAVAQQLLTQVKLWAPQSNLDAQGIPGLLSSAARKAQAAWFALRETPPFTPHL